MSEEKGSPLESGYFTGSVSNSEKSSNTQFCFDSDSSSIVNNTGSFISPINAGSPTLRIHSVDRIATSRHVNISTSPAVVLDLDGGLLYRRRRSSSSEPFLGSKCDREQSQFSQCFSKNIVTLDVGSQFAHHYTFSRLETMPATSPAHDTVRSFSALTPRNLIRRARTDQLVTIRRDVGRRLRTIADQLDENFGNQQDTGQFWTLIIHFLRRFFN